MITTAIGTPHGGRGAAGSGSEGAMLAACYHSSTKRSMKTRAHDKTTSLGVAFSLRLVRAQVFIRHCSDELGHQSIGYAQTAR